MNKQLMDIECFINYFCIGLEEYNTGEKLFYEISEERNDIHLIYNYLIEYKDFMITFNGIHYDNVVLKYLIHNYNRLKNLDYGNICLDLKQFSDKVINDDFNDEIKFYRYYKVKWTDIDLFLYWSKMLRMSKKISLKSLGIQLNYPVVQELPFKPDTILLQKDLESLRYYNQVHDLGILRLLTKEMEPQIVQRADAIVKFRFGSECYSWDGVKLGLNILLKEYCIANNRNYYDIKQLRTPFPLEGIKIGDLILPKVKFKPTEEKVQLKYDKKNKPYYLCNSFYSLYNHIKERTVYSTTELSYRVIFNNIAYDIKSGGLHSWHENEVVEPDPSKYLYKDIDVSSYYPSLGAEYEFVPQHLPGMNNVIRNIKTLRLKYKAEGLKKDAELYKLSLNGGYYGNLNSEYTPMYDPKALLSVTINGQLFLLMLAEMMEEAGISVDMKNTDGSTLIVPIEKESLFKEIYHKWEEITNMEMEEVDYKKVVRKNINNYIAISPDGKVKRKGLFKLNFDEKGNREIPLGDSIDEIVISKALHHYFVNDVEPEEIITNPDKYDITIFDYCKSNKISKQYDVIHNNQIQQNLNRYYFSKNGPYLFKRKKGKNTLEHVNVGEGVILYNKHEVKPWNEYNINYAHYISATNKIISEIERHNQLTLF